MRSDQEATRRGYVREREMLVTKQIRANNSLLQAVTRNDQEYWRARRNDLEQMIFDLDAHHEALLRESL